MSRGNRRHSIATTLALLAIFGGLFVAPDVGAGVRRKAGGATARADSAPTVRHAIYARILSIDADMVVVDRGIKDGLSVGRADLVVHPLRKRFGEKSKSIDALTILAGARVEAVDEARATLRLVDRAGTVEVGDIVGWRVEVAEGLAEDPLFRVAAMDIVLKALDPAKPLYTLGERLADPSQTFGDALLERLLAEIKSRIALADKAFKRKDIPGGRFHGISLSEAFRRTTKQDVLDFLIFVDGFPGKYIGQDWNLVEVYATWIINKTPSGEGERVERIAGKILAAAQSALEAGDLGEAEKQYREALKIDPKSEKAKERLERIDRCWQMMRDLKRSANDHELRYKLMIALGGMRAWPLTIEQAKILIKAKFRLHRSQYWHAASLEQLGQLDAALEVLQRIRVPEDEPFWQKEVAKRIESVQERRKTGHGKAKTFEELLAAAEADEKAGRYDDAQRTLLQARKVAKTAREFAAIGAVMQRVGAVRAIEKSCTSLQNDVRDHVGLRAAKRGRLLRKLAERQPSEAERIARCVAKAADKAMEVAEDELAVVLARLATRIAPKNADHARTLAWNLWVTQQLDAAEKAVRHAISLEPGSHFAWHMLGLILVVRGDLDGAENAARKAAESPSYAWPYQTLARIAAARGDWKGATEAAREAQRRKPDHTGLGLVVNDTLRGAAASSAIAAGSGDRARERLRLLRTFVGMELWKQAAGQLDALRGTAHFDAACWAIAESTDRSAPLRLRAAAAAAAKPRSPREHALRDRLASELQLAAAKDRAARQRTRVRLAAQLVHEGRFDAALGAIGGLADKAVDEALTREASDIATKARRGLSANAEMELADADRTRGGALEQAEARYATAYKAFDGIGAYGRASSAAFWRVAVLGMQGKVEQGLQELERVEPQLERHLAPLARLDMSLVAANLRSWRGKLDAVAGAVEEGIRLCTALDEDLCVENMRVRRSSLLLSEGRQADAAKEATVALQFAKERGIGDLYRRALFQLADTRLVEGDLPAALQLGQELLKNARAAKDGYHEQLGLMLAGAVAMRRGDAPAALSFFADVVRVGERLGDRNVQGIARLFEGFTKLDTAHDAQAALPAFTAAEAHFRAVSDDYSAARAQHGAGRAQLELGHADAARAVFEAALAYAESVGRPTLLCAIRIELCHTELLAKNAAAALAHAEKAAAVAAKVDIDSTRWAALHAHGLALAATGRKDDGAGKLKEATVVLARELARSGGEAEQQGSMGVGRARQAFRDAIDLLIQLGRTDDALEVLERSRDAALKRTFRNVRPEVKDKAASAALDHVQDAKQKAEAARRALAAEQSKPETQRSAARVKALGEKIADTEARVRQLLFRLKAEHPRLYTLAANVADPRTLLKRRAALPPRTVVAAYFVADDVTYVFTIAPDRKDTRAYKVPVGEAELRRTIGAWRGALPRRTPKVSVLSRKLYDKVLGPIEGDLQNADTVLVVPSGPLFSLPFGALETKVGGKTRYAVERWRFATMMSTTMASLDAPRRKERWSSFAAFANPDGSLPGAEAEVTSVAREVFRGATVFVGPKAVAEAVRDIAGKARILHFATHGVLGGEAAASYLKMAKGPLTLDLISGLDFGDTTDLVVLSACQTAVAVGETAEEGISIAEAFAFGGVPTLVASLWSVPDDATSELMVRFYRLLRGGDVDTVEALRRAQLELIALEKDGRRPFAHPLHWAAFGLIGDHR